MIYTRETSPTLPGCGVKIKISEAEISVTVILGQRIPKVRDEVLEQQLHDAVEAVLVPYIGITGTISCNGEKVADIIGPVTLEKYPQGWGMPANSKRAHYFVEGKALCGKWAFFGPLEDTNHEHPENCKECMKKRAKL